jgi:hypothetical protein
MAANAPITMSVVNRVRFTAWAWLASAFLVGATTGAVAAGVPLWKQLQTAKDDASRLTQVEILTRTVAPGSDVDALVSLEEPPRPDPAPAAKQPASEPTAVVAQTVVSNPVATVQAAPAEDGALAANAARAEEAERKAAEARKAAAAADEAERKAKADRQAKLEREQKLAKAAHEAQLKKDREREQAEARSAAARAKPMVESQDRREPVVQVAAPVPVAGTNGPTERVTNEEAGLSEVNAGGVTFKSGRRVAVGDSFPSGEKLISIDPRIGEIITSKRRIVIKPSAPTPGTS